MSTNHPEEAHTGPIKNPKQLLAAVLYAFVIPVFVIIGLVMFITSGNKPAPGAANPERAIAERIQKQVNSVSSLIEDPVVSQTKIDEEKAERDLEHRLHGREIFRGGKPDRSPSELLEQDKKK